MAAATPACPARLCGGRDTLGGSDNPYIVEQHLLRSCALLALKGHAITAQGNALGVKWADATQALKGRDKRLFHPFRVCGGLGHKDPGRCPGLIYDAPLGLFDVLAARSGWLYTPGQSAGWPTGPGKPTRFVRYEEPGTCLTKT